MNSVILLAAAAGLVAGHSHQHGHLHKRQDWSSSSDATTTSSSSSTGSATSSTTGCPSWTGGSSPPAFLTDLPASVQSELPSWTGAPPPDWCSQTSWMKSYTSANTVYESCSASKNQTGSTTATSSAVGADGTSSTAWGSWADPTSTASSSSSSSTVWSSWADPSATSSSISNTSTAWGTWADPSSTASSCGCTTTVLTYYGDPTWAPDVAAATTTLNSTSYTTVTVVPTAPSASSSWGSWADPSSTSSSSSSATESWTAWADPSTSSSSSASSTTSWGAWDDGSSTSASSTFSTTTTSYPAWSASSSIVSSSTASSTGSQSSGTSGGSGNAGIAPAGNYWAITYTPYTSSGSCKDAATVLIDITAIKALGFTTVRIYSTDCSGLANVGTAARAVGLKMILGVFIDASGISGASPQVGEIVQWGEWDLVEMIVVGNEALSNSYCDASDLAAFISSSKWTFKDAGYTGPVTTTEPLDIWQSVGSQLCSSVDVVAANLYAFFNAQTSADQAGAFIASEIQILDTICEGYKTYVVESGWPHAGQANGAAIPGSDEQKTAIKSIQDAVGSQVVFFTYVDDLWKQPGDFGVEQSWGCADVFQGINSGW